MRRLRGGFEEDSRRGERGEARDAGRGWNSGSEMLDRMRRARQQALPNSTGKDACQDEEKARERSVWNSAGGTSRVGEAAESRRINGSRREEREAGRLLGWWRRLVERDGRSFQAPDPASLRPLCTLLNAGQRASYWPSPVATGRHRPLQATPGDGCPNDRLGPNQ